jgi:hypothetical protein
VKLAVAVVFAALIVGAAAYGQVEASQPRLAPSRTSAHKSVLRVLAPPGKCWIVSRGRTDVLEGPSHRGCGKRSIGFDPRKEFEAFVSTEPYKPIRLGATLIADGKIVRRVRPRLVAAVRLRYGRKVPETTIVVRIEAKGCWSAKFTITSATSIEAVERTEQGCGSRDITLKKVSMLGLFVKRKSPGDWVSVALVVDGKVVAEVGPTTGQYPSLSYGWLAPREIEYSGEPPSPLP